MSDQNEQKNYYFCGLVKFIIDPKALEEISYNKIKKVEQFIIELHTKRPTYRFVGSSKEEARNNLLQFFKTAFEFQLFDFMFGHIFIEVGESKNADGKCSDTLFISSSDNLIRLQ